MLGALADRGPGGSVVASRRAGLPDDESRPGRQPGSAGYPAAQRRLQPGLVGLDGGSLTDRQHAAGLGQRGRRRGPDRQGRGLPCGSEPRLSGSGGLACPAPAPDPAAPVRLQWQLHPGSLRRPRHRTRGLQRGSELATRCQFGGQRRGRAGRLQLRRRRDVQQRRAAHSPRGHCPGHRLELFCRPGRRLGRYAGDGGD